MFENLSDIEQKSTRNRNANIGFRVVFWEHVLHTILQMLFRWRKKKRTHVCNFCFTNTIAWLVFLFVFLLSVGKHFMIMQFLCFAWFVFRTYVLAFSSGSEDFGN